MKHCIFPTCHVLARSFCDLDFVFLNIISVKMLCLWTAHHAALRVLLLIAMPTGRMPDWRRAQAVVALLERPNMRRICLSAEA